MIAAISFIPYLYPPKEIKAQDDASKLKYEEDVITKTAIGAAMVQKILFLEGDAKVSSE